MKRKKPIDWEHRLQCAMISWCRMQSCTILEFDLIYANPMGGVRNKITGAKLKREGARAGMPDLHLPVPRRPFASLYVEVKTEEDKLHGIKAGKLSEEQRERIEALRKAGNAVIVVRTLESFQYYVKLYLAAYAVDLGGTIYPDFFSKPIDEY